MPSPIGINAGNFSPSSKVKDVIAIAIIAVVVILVIIIVKKVSGGIDGALEMLGVKDTKEEIKAQETVNKTVDKNLQAGNGSAWSAKLYKTIKGAKVFTVASADNLAKKIYESVGHFTDNPNEGAGAIKQCYTKTQVSFLAERFQVKYNLDLLSWLELHYDTSEQKKVLANILTYVEALPLAKPK